MTRVLIVDDKEDNLDYLRSLLSAHGCTVDSAHDGAEALAQARSSPPDLVVSNLLMPVMDGYTLLRHWKADARLHQVPFIVFTATYTDPDDERLALNLGADAFILKHAEPEHLIARLREVQTNAVAPSPVPPRVAVQDENTRLKLYSEVLVRKLEERTQQLATANRDLRQKLAERKIADEKIRVLAESQMAILNALPAHIALVDPEGVILSVNEAWRRFALANVLQSPDFCVGQNYLKVCEQAVGDCSSEAQAIATGIRRVLRGGQKEFVIEYPCHSPDEQRWFRLMVTPLQEERLAGAVIMHVNITERKRDESELRLAERAARESEARLGFALAAADVGDWSLDLRTNVAHRSLRHDQCFGYREAVPQWGYDTFLAHIQPADRDRVAACFKTAMAGQGEYDAEFRTTWPDASVHWLWTKGRFYFDETGDPYRVAGIVSDITARKQAELALLESEARHRQISAQLAKVLDSSLDVICTFDAAGRFTQVSAACERVWGYRPDELLGTPFINLVHPEDRTKTLVQDTQIHAGQPVVSFENRYVRRDGSIVHILWSAWWSEAEQSNFCVAHDNTAAHHAQAALRESEAEFRMLAESMPQIVWMTRPDGWNIYFNQRWMDYTGLTLEESLGHGWNKPFHPDDQQRAWDAWRHATATGGLYSLEVRLRRADGAYQWWLVRGAAQLGPTGEIFKWFGTCTDIDESKRSQGLIAEQAALLDEAHDAIIVRDIEHRVTFWNRGAERLYGWTSAEALGRPVHELIRPTAATFEEALATLRRDGLWNGEIEKTTKAGAVLTLDASWTLLRDAQGQPRSILSIDTNITDRKKLEQQFLRAQRMESIGTLAGGIAHDLNNLLAPITMGVALLKLFAPDPRSLPVIENIERSARRGADLVKQVLSFARGVEGSRVALQVRHILHEVESIAQNTFPRNIRVETSFPPELWPVVADPTQLNQVVLNLAVNARDAMPNGGRLELKAENVVIDAQYALMNRGVGAGRYVKIQVTDGGIGIPREIIERIFDPFFTTKELGQGTGLGLSTVLGIVRSHGGFVNVYSELGKGSTFHVYLPAQEEGGPAQADVRIAETLPRGRGELVLVVDDEPPILEITRQTLLAFGYRVVTADDGAHAISVYALQRDKIAVVLTDMMMPVMDGPALIAALRRIDPQVRIIGASGLNANANVTRALGSGVRHFLPKPYSADALLTLLQQVLHGDESRPPR